MFWNKDKIPNYTIKTDEYNDSDSRDDDLFYYNESDDDFDSAKYKGSNSGAELFFDGDVNVNDSDSEVTQKNDIDYDKKEEFDKKISFANKVAGIILIIVVFIGMLVSIDIICVSRFNVGPFFAVRTNVLNDGGSKIYYGLGYKVIKYRQSGGRRDLVLGNWSLKYSTVAQDVDMVDLAIDFNSSNGNKYMNQFLKVDGEILSTTGHEITLIYLDDGGKYTTRLVCQMADGYNSSDIGDKKRISLVGTLYDSEGSKTKILKMKNCYIRDK